jgi:lipopolysaccharide heptosyltransferase I
MTPFSLSSPPARVLLIKPSAIGDVVHALPILRLMRNGWPNARLSWLVTPACSGLLTQHPLLDEVIVFDRRRYGQGYKSPKAALELRRFTKTLAERGFDLVVDLQGLFRSGWLAWKSGAPVRVGLATARECAPLFYTHRVAPAAGERHAIERYLDVAEYLSLGRGPVEFVFNTSAADRDAVSEKLAEIAPRPFAVVFPGANWVTKRWPTTHFAALLARLRDFGLATVIAGGSGDVSLTASLPADLNLCGRTTLSETTALLERASLVIANDTGPMHIAAALGVPMVTLFGPTSEHRTGPYGRPLTVLRAELPCTPCFSRKCSHISCMNWLKPEEVVAAVERQLRGVGP